MNLKHLRVFCQIVDSGSANLAAEKLHIAATAVSMQLSNLEESLGGKLFDRSTRPMSLTTLGQYIYPKAKALLSNARQMENEAKGIASGDYGWLSIGFVRSTLHSLIPESVRVMREEFPKIRIDLDEMLSEHQAENIRKGTIHIGISRQIGQYEKEKDMIYIPLIRDPLVAAIPINHPLAKKKTVAPSELDCLPFISFPKDPFSKFASQSLNYLQEHGATPNVGHEAKEIQTALGLVAAGLGITLVGKTVAKNNRTDVAFVPIKGKQLESEIFAITSSDKPSLVVQEFIRILCAPVMH